MVNVQVVHVEEVEELGHCIQVEDPDHQVDVFHEVAEVRSEEEAELVHKHSRMRNPRQVTSLGVFQLQKHAALIETWTPPFIYRVARLGSSTLNPKS